MTSSQDILDALDRAMKTTRQKMHYLTDANCPKLDNGEPVFYGMMPNAVCNHKVVLMHPDNLPAFLEVCAKIGAEPVDQRNYQAAMLALWKATGLLADYAADNDSLRARVAELEAKGDK
jgi:hypothetical protein